MATRKQPGKGKAKKAPRAKKPAPKKPARNRTNRTRKRPSGEDWGPAFLAALSRTGNVLASCGEAGVSRSVVYDRKDGDQAFAGQMKQALEDACDLLEQEARRRALEGVRRVKFFKGLPLMVPTYDRAGRPVLDAEGGPVLAPYVEHEYSDTLMLALLKAHRPEKFRESVKVDATLHEPWKAYAGFNPEDV